MAMINMSVDQFIKEKCQPYQHYQLIKPRPDRFTGWQENGAVRSMYYNWIMNESNCPSLKLDIEIPHAEILAEVQAQKHRFVKHRGSNHPGWFSMAIHGQGTEFTEPKEQYPDCDRAYDWTELAQHCPVTVDWLKNSWTFFELHRVRFMLLAPGGWISPHSDFETRRLAAYNVAISNPPGVEFAMEEAGAIPWQAGDVRAIDIGRLHALRHTGDQDRIHMIIHGKEHVRHHDLVCRSFDILCQELNLI
jgi:hypothetical protein